MKLPNKKHAVGTMRNACGAVLYWEVNETSVIGVFHSLQQTTVNLN